MELTRLALPDHDHEDVIRVEDRSCGLHAIIAIHSTALGPSAGGLRMRPYASEEEALDDVLRLSRGMTYKNAAAGLPLGGGKAVILGDPARDKSPELLERFGEAVAALDGRYWTAEDMGMTPADMARIASRTNCVAGLEDGPFASGDPSPVTARGIFNGIRITARHRFGRDDLHGLRVAVQGLGHVGLSLCEMLHAAGARLVVADVSTAPVEEARTKFDATVVAPDRILMAEADILAPCAIGAILNERTIPQLRVAAVAGGANNQLATAEDGARLHASGILYAPDFVVNAGGIINVATEILRIADRESWVRAKLDFAGQTLDRMLTRARAEDVSPNAVAEATVEEILSSAKTAQAAE